MMRYLLDTNHLSPLVTLGHPLEIKFTERLEHDQFAFCTPSLTELLFGIGIIPRARQNRSEWSSLSELFVEYILDRESAIYAAEIQIQLRKKGWQLQTVDAQIAAIALINDLTLLTTDRDFSAVPYLQTENWLA